MIDDLGYLPMGPKEELEIVSTDFHSFIGEPQRVIDILVS
jgi:hypothetical protein